MLVVRTAYSLHMRLFHGYDWSTTTCCNRQPFIQHVPWTITPLHFLRFMELFLSHATTKLCKDLYCSVVACKRNKKATFKTAFFAVVPKKIFAACQKSLLLRLYDLCSPQFQVRSVQEPRPFRDHWPDQGWKVGCHVTITWWSRDLLTVGIYRAWGLLTAQG